MYLFGDQLHRTHGASNLPDQHLDRAEPRNFCFKGPGMGKRLLYVKLQTGAERQPCFKMDLMRTYLQGPKMRVRRGPFVLAII